MPEYKITLVRVLLEFPIGPLVLHYIRQDLVLALDWRAVEVNCLLFFHLHSLLLILE